MSREVVVVDGLRTPYARAGTELKDVSADELGRVVSVELLARTNFDPEDLDEVVFGNITTPKDTTEAEHRALVDAIRTHNPLAAEERMREHLLAVRRHLFGLR